MTILILHIGSEIMVIKESRSGFVKILLTIFTLAMILTPTAVGLGGNSDSKDSCRSSELTIDTVILEGSYNGEQAEFILTYKIYMYSNASLELPLIGPSESAMANNLSIDGKSVRVHFKSSYYYFKGTLEPGEHNLTFEFSSKILSEGKKVLNYELLGPALIFRIDFMLPMEPSSNIHIDDTGDGVVIDNYDHYLIKWEHYATDMVNWALEWTEYTRPEPAHLRCEVEASALVSKTGIKLNVDYVLNFQGYGLEDLFLQIDPGTKLISVGKGSIKNIGEATRIEFADLVFDHLELKVEFQLSTVSEPEISVPAVDDCMYSGSLAVFADSELNVQHKPDKNTANSGYVSSKYPGSYFVGNYIISEQSSLTFNITERESILSAEVLETLQVTQAGYLLETIILFSFSGNNPSSITIDLAQNSQVPLKTVPRIWIESSEPDFVMDHNWDAQDQRLIIFLDGNLTGDYTIGVEREFTENKVKLEQISITDMQVINYFLIFYHENGVALNLIDSNGLLRSDYDDATRSFKQHLKSGVNADIYSIPGGQYNTDLEIVRSFDMQTEMFLRTWVTDVEIASKQVVRISTDNMLVNSFTFIIPVEHQELDVSGSASWSVVGDRLTVYISPDGLDTVSFIISSKPDRDQGLVNPFLPVEIEDYEIYAMFGSSSSLELNISYTGAEVLSTDELPAYFKTELRTSKAVNIYYSTGSPTFEFSIEELLPDIPPSTIIEQAQITLITSVDGRNAVQVIYMVKNVERLDMEVILPQKSVVWMVLVAAKTVPIIQEDNRLTITLIRSTLVGENIAFPVEFVYMVKEPTEDLQFLLPAVDVSVLSMKINIGLPKSLKTIDPGATNPGLEYHGEQPWSSSHYVDDTTTGEYIDYNKAFDAQMSNLWFDKDNTNPASLTIGIDDVNDNSKPVVISKYNELGRVVSNQSLSTYQFFSEADSDFGYQTVSLTQGNYMVTNGPALRKVSVIGGVAQQIIFDSEEDMVFTPAPPIYLQFPEGGKVVKFSTIFVMPEEQLSISIEEDTSEGSKGQNEKIISKFRSPVFYSVLIAVIVILIVVSVSNFLKKRRSRSMPQSRPKKSVNKKQFKKEFEGKVKKRKKAVEKEGLDKKRNDENVDKIDNPKNSYE
jgi:hypothetical protein